MIVYLLVPVLVLGAVDSQTGNTTNTATASPRSRTEAASPLSRTEAASPRSWTEAASPRSWTEAASPLSRTEAASTLENITMEPSNVTSGLDEKRRVEAELRSNLTTAFTEDNEDFQDLEDQLLTQHCNWLLMNYYSQELCIAPFHNHVQNLDAEHWCNMDMVIGAYDDMALCVERVSHIFNCTYPSQDSHELFLSVHSSFFQNCTREAAALEDAPQRLVVTLTLIPVSLIPVLTYVVVWKSKVQG